MWGEISTSTTEGQVVAQFEIKMVLPPSRLASLAAVRAEKLEQQICRRRNEKRLLSLPQTLAGHLNSKATGLPEAA